MASAGRKSRLKKAFFHVCMLRRRAWLTWASPCAECENSVTRKFFLGSVAKNGRKFTQKYYMEIRIHVFNNALTKILTLIILGQKLLPHIKLSPNLVTLIVSLISFISKVSNYPIGENSPNLGSML
jgi:hypothetical protein